MLNRLKNKNRLEKSAQIPAMGHRPPFGPTAPLLPNQFFAGQVPGMPGIGIPGPGIPGMPGMGMPGIPGMGMPGIPGMGMPGMGMPGIPGMGMPGMGMPGIPGMGMPGIQNLPPFGLFGGIPSRFNSIFTPEEIQELRKLWKDYEKNNDKNILNRIQDIITKAQDRQNELIRRQQELGRVTGIFGPQINPFHNFNALPPESSQRYYIFSRARNLADRIFNLNKQIKDIQAEATNKEFDESAFNRAQEVLNSASIHIQRQKAIIKEKLSEIELKIEQNELDHALRQGIYGAQVTTSTRQVYDKIVNNLKNSKDKLIKLQNNLDAFQKFIFDLSQDPIKKINSPILAQITDPDIINDIQSLRVTIQNIFGRGSLQKTRKVEFLNKQKQELEGQLNKLYANNPMLRDTIQNYLLLKEHLADEEADPMASSHFYRQYNQKLYEYLHGINPFAFPAAPNAIGNPNPGKPNPGKQNVEGPKPAGDPKGGNNQGGAERGGGAGVDANKGPRPMAQKPQNNRMVNTRTDLINNGDEDLLPFNNIFNKSNHLNRDALNFNLIDIRNKNNNEFNPADLHSNVQQ